MRHEAGQSVKSSVSHSWTRDTRDDRFTATMGAYNKLTHELAGLGGDAAFYKVDAESQLARQVLPGLVRAPCSSLPECYSLRLFFSHYPLRRGWAHCSAYMARKRCFQTASSLEDQRASACSARIAWGRGTDVRAYSSSYLGVVDQCCIEVDSLGGDLYWSAGVSAISDLPRKAHWPLKAHLFLNAGRLSVMNSRMCYFPFSGHPTS